MEIKVLGPGCTKCRQLYDLTGEALKRSGVAADLQKVEKIDEIMTYGVLLTPALVVDGDVLCTGKLPRMEEIQRWIVEAAASG